MTLNSREQRIVAAVHANLPWALDLLQKSVDIPSSTMNLSGVRKVGDLFAEECKAIGLEPHWVDLPAETGRAGHLVAEKKFPHKGKRILLIGHLDTVLEGSPFVRDGDWVHGNGTSDMKGGDVIILAALRSLRDAHALDHGEVLVFMAGDEEDTGPMRDVTRQPLIELGKRSDIALAFESTSLGTGTVARRGTSEWILTVEAKSGHSSLIFTPDLGSGATFEASRILAEMYDRMHGEQYLTFNASVMVGGSRVEFDREKKGGSAEGKTNVIPSKVVVEGDLRFISLQQRDEARRMMTEIATRNLPGTSASFEFRDGYPAMPPTDGNYKLLRVFDEVSRDGGFGPITALDPGKRGAGDISFVAPYVAGLDGLGSVGADEHAEGERADLATFPMLIQRAAILIDRLLRSE